jgi:Polyketide cyclase / dehydrase and lipid transport
MSVDVVTEVDIRRPRSLVAGFASDPDNATKWYVNIKSVRWETPPPAVVGSRVAFEARFLGRSIAYVYEVREIVPDERFVMSTADGPFPMRTTYTWVDAPGGQTHMTLRNTGEPSGFGSIAAPILAAAMRRANRRDLARLKAILEAADVA